MNNNAGVLAGYVDEVTFAAEARISQRTSARYRKQPDGLPYVEFGGRIYIPLTEAREWLGAKIKRPNQRRRAA
ncbi:MAG: hypothetical protein U1E25_07350 [Methylocystis sp.]